MEISTTYQFAIPDWLPGYPRLKDLTFECRPELLAGKVRRALKNIGRLDVKSVEITACSGKKVCVRVAVAKSVNVIESHDYWLNITHIEIS